MDEATTPAKPDLVLILRSDLEALVRIVRCVEDQPCDVEEMLEAGDVDQQEISDQVNRMARKADGELYKYIDWKGNS
jgi:hypothetical protein